MLYIAKIRIANWPEEVMKYLSYDKIKVHIAKSYIDDIRWVIEKIEKGNNGINLQSNF